MATKSTKKPAKKASGAKDMSKLRSRRWFANADNTDMTALYLERYMNFGLSREELQAGKPIIGIAQSGSDLSPCNRHHLVLAERVREGIRFRRRASAPQLRSTATWRISDWSRFYMATSSTALFSPQVAIRPRPRS
jgi:dihydroxyacid dehydratase/phosphogluconate dehydratase